MRLQLHRLKLYIKKCITLQDNSLQTMLIKKSRVSPSHHFIYSYPFIKIQNRSEKLKNKGLYQNNELRLIHHYSPTSIATMYKLMYNFVYNNETLQDPWQPIN